jgi:replicative DNA helicase
MSFAENLKPDRGFADSTAMAETPHREPPHNLEAEQALLGAILVNNRAFERVGEFLAPEHFADPVHGRIFAACATLIDRGQIATPVTLKGQFDQDEALQEVGGAQYLVKLAASVVTVINAEDYGREIRDCFLRRELIDIGETVVNDAFDRDIDTGAPELIEKAEHRLFTLAETGHRESGPQAFSDSLSQSIAMAEASFRRDTGLAGLATGLADLDRVLGGLHPSDLVILAARPAMGKSALAANIAFHVATSALREGQDPKPVVFFSLEMSAEQISTRVLAERTGIPSDRIRRGQIARDDFNELVDASEQLKTADLFVDDTGALSLSALRTRARRIKRQHGLALIVVDYLQIMTPPPGYAGAQNRVQAVSALSQGLKALAKELDVPVLALSQLSRAVEQREDKRPVLADLRDSGAIEQDADVVMFIYREEYYRNRSVSPTLCWLS